MFIAVMKEIFGCGSKRRDLKIQEYQDVLLRKLQTFQ